MFLFALPCKASNTVMIGVSYFNNKIAPSIWLHYTTPQPNQTNLFRPMEKHHGYAGVALYFVGKQIHSHFISNIGAILFIDDSIQHILRIQSPIHLLNNYLWKYRWYRKLEQF